LSYTPLRPRGKRLASHDSNIGGGGQQFPATRWSVLEGTRSVHADERQRALDALVAAYWRPVYKYIRLHWSKESEEAKDLTQDFFLRLLEKQLLDRFDPSRARLRTYLRVCIDGLVMNTDKSSQRLKRGGELTFLALDFESAESELKRRTSTRGTPEDIFAHEFARSLFGLAVDRLRKECEQKGKALHFRLLELYDIEEGGKELTYEQVAERFGIKDTDVTNYLAFARKEFRRIVLEELRTMTSSDDEFRREAQAILGVRLG
jgi:RNA polymerase sigma factor (sigma-70 family)